MKMIQEFKAFALKGNVVDLAVGVIIGGAFGKIVSSFVNDLVMPLLGMLVGGVHFGDLKLVLREATETIPALTLNYGNFLQLVFDFIIIAWAVFMAIKALSSLKKQPAPVDAPPVATPEDIVLLREIRDSLKK
jgi:large conductance mechanosensitive channel